MFDLQPVHRVPMARRAAVLSAIALHGLVGSLAMTTRLLAVEPVTAPVPALTAPRLPAVPIHLGDEQPVRRPRPAEPAEPAEPAVAKASTATTNQRRTAVAPPQDRGTAPAAAREVSNTASHAEPVASLASDSHSQVATGPPSHDLPFGPTTTDGSAGTGNAATAGSAPVRLHAGITAPVAISQTMPDYPPACRSLGCHGVVVCEATIDRDGHVVEVRAVSSPHPLLEQAAVAAMRRWRFQPAVLDGQPIPVFFTLTVRFKLR